MKSLTHVFRTTINQLCRWHIEQNIMKNYRKYFSNVAEFDSFMKQIQKIASSVDRNCQEEELTQLRDKFPIQAADYFFDQRWTNGLCESWAEIHVRKYSNFGISTSLKLHTATKLVNRKGTEQSQQLSVVGSNQNLFVRLEIRNQINGNVVYNNIPTCAGDGICRRSEEVVSSGRGGTAEKCSSTIRSRYLLPCSHHIELGRPIDLPSIHPRWRVQATLAINVPPQHVDPAILAVLQDPPVAMPRIRKGRPKGMRRLQTSAEIVQQAADRTEKARQCGSWFRVREFLQAAHCLVGQTALT
ncbi:hypothetical protein V1517DRAFT_31318 [Lipomyces orientalis]|uniref:Uncharacterized protein n=1 Tax=Lipomyces orientalis TaxID=1233043 RepID=A0ACC3TF94_9ASCO